MIKLALRDSGRPMISFLQANLNRARAAQALIMQLLFETKAEVAIISEPNKIPANDRWYGSTDLSCCLYLTNNVNVINSGQGKGYVWLDFPGLRVYSCYFSPNRRHSIDEYRVYLSCLEESIRQGPSEVIVAGDFNAHSPCWGSPSTCPKGDALTDFFNSLGLVVVNQGGAPTFERGGQSSHIDVTFASPSVYRQIDMWKVLGEDVASDHHPILFRLRGDAQLRLPSPTGWSWRRLDTGKLAAFLQTYDAGQKSFDDAGLSDLLAKACDSCMPRRTFHGRGKPVHWWTEEIAALRKASFQARRRYQKARKRRGPEDCREEQDLARQASKALRLEIRRSQERCWDELCRQVDTDPWGVPYKIVSKKLIGRQSIPGIKLPGRLDMIIHHLFPRSQPPTYPVIDLDVTSVCPFTMEELKEAGRSLPTGKAPGPDGVPDEILRNIIKIRPDLLLPTFNECLTAGKFFDSWKMARLVLLRKGTKPLDQPSSYRPLCLINSIGKLYERLLKARIIQHLNSQAEGISAHQYGFMKGRSTVQAINKVMTIVNRAGSGQLYNRKLCALASLDVANAFNSAPWARIDAALIGKRFPNYIINMIRSYFEDRCIITDQGTYSVCTGVPQGSVIGPILWNIFYDGLMRLEYPDGVHIVCFADDAAIVATGYTTMLLERAMNDSLQMVDDWMAVQGLTLSNSKSTAVMLTTKRGYVKPVFHINGAEIELSDNVRYLGVQLSSVLGFRKHVEVVSEKAAKTTSALSRLMPNVGGPKAQKRKLLSTVVHAQLLYAAPVWYGALRHECNRAKMSSPQRKMALRVASAYCTVSNDAIMVVAGIVPIHLLAEESAEVEIDRRKDTAIEAAKHEARRRCIVKWQKEWDESSKGRWTYRLIPDIHAWLKRKWGNIDYHITQFLTGHGCFNAYLKRFKKRSDAVCMYCGHAEDDVQHTFFDCDRWWLQRRELEAEIGGSITPEMLGAVLIQSKSKWETVAKYVNEVLSRKESDERAMQASQA